MLKLQKTCQFSAWVLVLGIIVLSVVPARDRPVTPMPHTVEHLGIFILTGAAFGVGYWRYLFFSIVAVTIFSGLIELIQLYLPDRHARLSDFIIDACSISIGVIIGAFVVRFGTRYLSLNNKFNRSHRERSLTKKGGNEL